MTEKEQYGDFILENGAMRYPTDAEQAAVAAWPMGIWDSMPPRATQDIREILPELKEFQPREIGKYK